ncbi:hypothetical protein HYALB_00009341 [Hymenoscyphus albidus]|uniref:Uncharacterized protein n=1 Tax=Hymenoscyphus albidus TaxID=595503 RepID=A0A9N9Q7I8_9HELO|nr:hypothetical protein HYALB_00009341 [Hymenoscyphus albidus]
MGQGLRYWVNYIGWYSDPELDYHLADLNDCPQEHSNNFLAIWAEQTNRNTTEYSPEHWLAGMTAVFCIPSYHVQQATVTVNATTQAIVPIGIDNIRSTIQSLGIELTANSTVCKNQVGERSFTYIIPSTPSGREILRTAENPTVLAHSQTDDRICPSVLMAEFSRAGGPEHYRGNFTAGLDRNVSSTWITCSPSLEVAPFQVTVDLAGNILASKQTGKLNSNISSFFTNNYSPSTLYRDMNKQFTATLLQLSLNTTTISNPHTDPRKASLVAPAMEHLYRQLFATYLALNPTMFLPASPSTPDMLREVTFQETRIFVSFVNARISVVIIFLHVLVAVWYYANRPKRFLPRMPTSIASVMAYVAASRAAEDFSRTRNHDGKGLKLSEERYGYGRFLGRDGKTYIGIEKQRFVVPLESLNPDEE